MKPVAIIFSLVLAPLVLRAGDLQVTSERKRTDGGHNVTQYQKHPQGPQANAKVAETSKAAEKWQYSVKITNSSFNPMPALQAQYVIFVERQQLGEKVGPDPVEKIKGTASVAAMAPHGETSFDTSEVSLQQQSLMGLWYFKNGGRIKAMDNIQGIWVKFFDGTNQVGEYASPTTLATRNKWE